MESLKLRMMQDMCVYIVFVFFFFEMGVSEEKLCLMNMFFAQFDFAHAYE